MDWQFTPYAIPLFVNLAIMGGIVVTSWQRRSSRGAMALLLLALASGFYIGGYILEIGSTSPATVLTWLKLQYLGVATAPVFLLMLALHFSDQQRFLVTPVYALLFMIPVMTIAFAFTNEYHHLIWQITELDRSDGFTKTLFEPGGWYWVQIAYFQAAVLVSLILFGRTIRQASGLYRRQVMTLFLATLEMPISHLIYLSRLILPGFDLNTYTLSIALVMLAWGVFYYRLMNLMPIVREAVLSSMSDAVIVMDNKSRVLYLNPRAQNLFDAPPENYFGKLAKQVFANYPQIAVLSPRTDEYHIEIELEAKGIRRSYDVSVSPLRRHEHESPDKLACIIVMRNITDRVEAMKALEETNLKLQMLRQIDRELTGRLSVDYVAEIGLDAALRISLAETGFIALLDSDSRLRIVKAIGGFGNTLPSHMPENVGIAKRVIQSKRPELVLDVRQDPDYVALVPGMAAQITAPLLSHNNLIGILILETATADRFNPDIYDMTTLLASRLAVAIDNAQLYEQTNSLAKELEAFGHTVAHDLKNPIGNIKGYAEFIIEEDDLARHKDYAKIIVRAAEKCAGIINALLLLAKVRDQSVLELRPVVMNDLMQDLQLRLAPEIRASGAQLELPASWPTINSYPPWIEEIWANYLSNAIKYGGQPPRIQIGYDEPAEGKLRFWVRDNGKGLTAEEQAQLFTPFNRIGGSRAEGHGLGLTIVQRIAEKLDGEVGVESKVGEGSLFYFILPKK